MSCATCDPGICICPPTRSRAPALDAETRKQMTEWLPPEQPATTSTRQMGPEEIQTPGDSWAPYEYRVVPPPASEIQVGGSHYKDFAIQPAEFIHKNAIGFLEGNVIKYVCRHSKKNGVEDLKKARHYIDLLIEYGNK